MGAFSRSKGKREELGLCTFLRALGFTDVGRVPLSGAMKGYKHDVLATVPETGQVLTFELKSRKEAYKWIYAFTQTEGKRWVLPGRPMYRNGKECPVSSVAVGATPQEALSVGFLPEQLFTRPIEPKTLKLATKLIKLDSLRAGADLLVLKINRYGYLFLKFYG